MDYFSKYISKLFAEIFDDKGMKDSLVLKIIIGSITVIIIASMFPRGESIEYSYEVGSLWSNKDLIAPFSFSIFKDARKYEAEKQEAAHSVYPVFEHHDEIAQTQLGSLETIMEFLRVAVDARERWMESHSPDDFIAFDQSLNRFIFSFSEKEWSLLGQWRSTEKKRSNQTYQKIQHTLSTVLNDILRIGVSDQIRIKQTHQMIAVRHGNTEEIMPSQKVYDLDDALTTADARVNVSFGDNDTSAIAEKILRAVLRPNIIFNQTETDYAIQIAQDNVPRTIGFVQENERILSKNDRITEEIKLKLDSFRKAKAERSSEHNLWSQWIGIILHVILILTLYGIYLFLFRKKIYHDNAMLALIALLMVLETFFAYLSITINITEPLQYLIFVPAASMLLVIIFDSRVAFYGTVTIAFLVAGIRGNDYSIALASLVAGALGAYTVREIHERTQIFRSLIFIFLGYLITIVALSIERFDSFNTIAAYLTFALANAVFSPVLTYGLLIFFERVFGVTTDLTLIELSDFNHPLLRQLSEKAPGTFHHSMIIGNLAEAAADAIGANSILARAGAYYHDIGKIEKPEYFVENQVGLQNKHNRLRPRMSALILSSHVKEGIEVGRQQGIPQNVLDFIPQHHGTTRISFFYDKALKQAAAKKNPKDIINEEDFLYPGPKPQTKETAIVMLADSVEASTRAFTEITPQRLEHAIENMVRQRIAEGQLDECELTLRDLTKIKEAFLKILIGIHHQRIIYPEQEKPEPVVEQKQLEQPKTIEPLVEVKPAVAVSKVEKTSQQSLPEQTPPVQENIQ